MDIFLIITGSILMVLGILGSLLPILPGIPLSYLGIILLHLSSKAEYSWTFLLGWGLAVLIVQVIDYFLPIWGTKKYGGSKLGIWGSTIGLIIGLFVFPPWGMIILPFFGAVAGELTNGKQMQLALKIGFGTFVGFLTGTICKLIIAVVLAFIFFKEVFSILATSFQQI